ncbi:glycosyltransferase family 4 protein [Phenylobacterium sp. VNQ135]|uniref:glycosyltransferase family 4 protein n=1 Tax=Phenylobacterium sp. VNQ135 TaxID=3400922 RepID=UPI003C042FBF
MDAAILFENDGYRMDGPKLMGRQSAGNGFLRAAVAAHAGRPLWGFSPFSDAGAAFQQTVTEIDPNGQTRWIDRGDLRGLSARGVAFRPDGDLGGLANLRLRAGPARFSICGVTHTLSGPPLATFAGYPALPLAPWDALICTSRAARGVLEGVLEASEDLLSWRAGATVRPPRPQLPIIPLGVHTRDFDFTADERAAARTALGLAPDEVAVLFAGRISFHGKAHPFQMFQALEAAAQTTGVKLALVLAGQAPTEAIKGAYDAGLAAFCPSVRAVYVDGKDFDLYRAAWAGADIFTSLSDNIQETFGITPLEAMASGLPVVVSDWDGYRDTVRDGEDGFRIPTLAPAPGHLKHVALAYEAGAMNYDQLLYRTCAAVSMDYGVLLDRLTALVRDPDLRRRMGETGRRRAREDYDWAVVYRRYQALWDELTAVRERDYAERRDYWDRAPRATPGHREPFEAFAGFSTAALGPETLVAAAAGASPEAYAALEGQILFNRLRVSAPIIEAMFARLAAGPASVAELQAAAKLGTGLAVEVVARLVKMNLVRVV